MDKNIAALLREDTRTVHVSFDLALADFDEIAEVIARPAGAGKAKQNSGSGARLYTYVTHLSVEPGDSVIVEAAGAIEIAYVVRVDEDVAIEPNSEIAYKWIVDKVDVEAFEANKKRNTDIERAVGDAYRTNLRRSFAQTILGAVPDDRRDGLTKLLKGN